MQTIPADFGWRAPAGPVVRQAMRILYNVAKEVRNIMYELAWQEFANTGRGTLVSKTKEFPTREQLERFKDHLVDKANFYQVLGWR